MNRVKLYEIFTGRFSEGELRTLCFRLGVDYESLPGSGKSDKARELVAYAERHQLVSDLVTVGEDIRPDIDWNEVGVERVPLQFLELEFVNREDELHRLSVERLRASRSPYTLVSAPAGYGKSYLLKRLAYEIHSNAELCQQWRLRYIEFGHDDVAPVLHIAREIMERTFQSDPDVSEVCDYVLRELTAPVAGGDPRRAVLLMFDAVEKLSDLARQWIYALLRNLYQRARPSEYRELFAVRVIIAGRSVQQFWEGYMQAGPVPPAPRRIVLSPFDQYAVQDLIWSRAAAAHIPLDDQTVIQIANEVGYLSGGHPQVIRNLVEDLAAQVFAIGPIFAYFERNRARLIRRCLVPVADALLQSVDPVLRPAVRVLSIFRRVNGNTVEALVAGGFLPPGTDVVDLLQDLIGAHLLSAQSLREPFYRDHLIRRILALDVAYRSEASRAQYEQLNCLALDLYARWIREGLQDRHLGPLQRLLSVVEWLFHALQVETLETHQVREGVQNHIRILGAETRDDVVGLIVEEIRNDVEICYLLNHRLGDEGFLTVQTWLLE